MTDLRSRFTLARVAFGASLLGSAALVGAGMFGAHGVAFHEKLRSQVENARVLNDSLKRDNRRLRQEAKALRSDPDYIEAVIRDELGWVRKDEMIFIFPEDRSGRAAEHAPDRAQDRAAPVETKK